MSTSGILTSSTAGACLWLKKGLLVEVEAGWEVLAYWSSCCTLARTSSWNSLQVTVPQCLRLPSSRPTLLFWPF